MPTWEYMTWNLDGADVRTSVGTAPDRALYAGRACPGALADAGTRGWELVGFDRLDSGDAVMIFKRPRSD